MEKDLYSITKGYGTGALPHPHDARDFQIERIPAVTAVATPPQFTDYSRYVWMTYNQGSLPACVLFSEAGMLSIYDNWNENKKRAFDPAAVYWELGGDGRNGVSTSLSLKYAVDKGFPVANSNQRDPIASYAFTRDPMTMVNALAAGKLCVMAILLPTDFLNGDCYSMQMSSAYHQVCVVGYDLTKKRFKFLNSWGTWYGNNGLGTISFDYLTQQNNQNGYFYAYTVLDLIEGDAKPPPVGVIVGYQTSISGTPRTVVNVKQHFIVVGKGFGTTKGVVKFSGLQLGVASWTDTAIETYYNLDLVKDVTGDITVTTAAGDVITGPAITIEANTNPTPVGRKIDIHASWQRLGGMKFLSVMTRWTDDNTPAVGVMLDATVGVHKLVSQKSGSAGGAYWIFDSSFIGLTTINAHEVDKPITGTTTLMIT